MDARNIRTIRGRARLFQSGDSLACERCGSSDIMRGRSSQIDRFVRFLTGKKRLVCRGCGWTARRLWDPTRRPDRVVPQPVTRAITAEHDEFDIDRFH
ncbi:MAG TPA: hypothetical protein VEC39_19065 [Vicinamibacterales bacterium]|nr:hypothetical protein [Vicinamibacterales bacterium]